MNPRSAMTTSPLAKGTRSSRSPPFSSVNAIKLKRSAKPGQRGLPEIVQKRFVSHAMLESDSIPAGKPYVSAYGLMPGGNPDEAAISV